jgi:sec-independent protein translocase protein TatB
MFNVNPLEIVVIAVLVLVLFGPEKLPEMAVQLGKLYRDFRLMADAASAEFTREIQAAARSDAVAEAEAKARDAQERSIAPPRPAEDASPALADDAAPAGPEGGGDDDSEPPGPDTGAGTEPAEQ